MTEFLAALVRFPTVLFTAALVVAVVFWLLVLCGVAAADSFDTDLDTDALHLGGVPVAVSASLLIALAWFLGLTGSVLLTHTGFDSGLPRVLLLPAALCCAWWLTRRLVRPLTKLFPDEPGPSRQDFIGLTCVIRTGRVDAVFGQAEVRARDGSTAVVQVRQNDTDPLAALTLGGTGLLYAYDDAGEFFWVAPY
ncbi:hypothetical protein [Streptomyces sp. NPDC020965]|uniref:hypothetical protein n=1 Tax=Streptomyces sp. NPDC020965 TaxID=3365105 RepID=UPI0037B6B33A